VLKEGIEEEVLKESWRSKGKEALENVY